MLMTVISPQLPFIYSQGAMRLIWALTSTWFQPVTVGWPSVGLLCLLGSPHILTSAGQMSIMDSLEWTLFECSHLLLLCSIFYLNLRGQDFNLGLSRRKIKLVDNHVSPSNQHVLTSCLLRPVGHFRVHGDFSTPSSPVDSVMLKLSSDASSKENTEVSFPKQCLWLLPPRQRLCSMGRGSFSLSVASSWLSLWFSARVAPKLSCLSRNEECSIAAPLCRHLEVRGGLRRCHQSDCESAIIHSHRLTEVAGRNVQLQD